MLFVYFIVPRRRSLELQFSTRKFVNLDAPPPSFIFNYFPIYGSISELEACSFNSEDSFPILTEIRLQSVTYQHYATESAVVKGNTLLPFAGLTI